MASIFANLPCDLEFVGQACDSVPKVSGFLCKTLGLSAMDVQNFFFSSFFFLISKKTYILEKGKVPSSTQEVDKMNQPNKKQKPINYLLPNQVRKSTT